MPAKVVIISETASTCSLNYRENTPFFSFLQLNFSNHSKADVSDNDTDPTPAPPLQGRGAAYVWSVECGVRSDLLAPGRKFFTLHSSLFTSNALHFQHSSLNICKGTTNIWYCQKRRGVACENLLRKRGWNVKIRNWRTLSERVGFFLWVSDALSQKTQTVWQNLLQCCSVAVRN